jgi:hypothetical protein
MPLLHLHAYVMDAYKPRSVCTCDDDVTGTINPSAKRMTAPLRRSASNVLKAVLKSIGPQLYEALEWQQLKKITVGLCLRQRGDSEDEERKLRDNRGIKISRGNARVAGGGSCRGRG